MRWYFSFLLAMGWAIPGVAQPPAVQQIINEVNADSLVWRMERLTGEVAVDVGPGDELIVSRHNSPPGNALAPPWIQQELARMGYTPVVQPFGTSGENVLAIKPGAVHPERKVIIGAHYDCMPGLAVAPGADDDGSGVCTVLEAARVMAGRMFGNTVVFALWDEEEQGLVGSAYQASVAAGNDEEIVAVVAMDAIGYDGDGDGLMRIHTRPIANSLAIKDSALMVNGAYGLDLPIAVNNPGATYSDHASFWNEGYGAILVIEDFDDDPNPYYHTPNDRLEHLDTAYWRGLARLAIGTAAVMAVPMGPTGVPQAPRRETLAINPNPTRDNVVISLPDGGAGAMPEVVDALGRPVPVHGVRNADGGWTLGVSDLAPGTYMVRLKTGNELRTARLVRWP
ncbi:MAG TPA: M20/M25/M40 family metallo-hydrolase [Flavobacteriales bacterium]|nr:M20/M25/M40 family metallo-hydrolase [Flavobacteriales bacterium]